MDGAFRMPASGPIEKDSSCSIQRRQRSHLQCRACDAGDTTAAGALIRFLTSGAGNDTSRAKEGAALIARRPDRTCPDPRRRARPRPLRACRSISPRRQSMAPFSYTMYDAKDSVIDTCGERLIPGPS